MRSNEAHLFRQWLCASRQPTIISVGIDLDLCLCLRIVLPSYNELGITDEFKVKVYIVNPGLKVEYH